MATVLLAVAVAASVAAIAVSTAEKDDFVPQETRPDGRNGVEGQVRRQQEWGYNSGAMQIRSGVLNERMPRLRFPNGSKTRPSQIANVFARATALAVQHHRDIAEKLPDRGMLLISPQIPPTLVRFANRRDAGAMANYPFATFEGDYETNVAPGDDAKAFSRIPFPSTFPGEYPISKAPDGLRNPWNPDGLLARKFTQARNPSISTRPPLPRLPVKKPSGLRSATKPWDRQVATD